MSELLENWGLAPIGSLCTLLNGRAFKPSDWTDKGLPIVRIQNLNKPEAQFNYFKGEVRERFLLNGGELLFAWSGTPGTSFGAHIWRGDKAVLNQHIFRVDFDELFIDKRFFRYAINQKLDELIGVAHGGVGLRHVTKGVFEKTEIAVPPHPEQIRIADKLDSLLNKVDSCKEYLAHVSLILKRFRQSVLAEAVSGKLTERWRDDNPKHLRARKVILAETGSETMYGTSAKSQLEGKVPVLRMGNIQDGKLDWENLKFTSNQDEIEKYKLSPGDVLFNRTNSPEHVGKTAVYKGERPAIPAGYLIRVKCGNEILPDYLSYCLNSPYGVDWRWRVKSDGVSQSNINATKLAAFEFSLPSLEEQHEIVHLVEALFALANRLEARWQAGQELVEKLTPSLLAKAFRGELVEQDPNDKPASVLLERIRVEREKAQAEKKTTKKKRAK
jgi:type I restriction enzyme, S subunit